MADAKLTALTATTAPLSTDIFFIVTDPGGTPASKKVTGANLGKALTLVGVVTVTQPATAATITIINNKTFTVNKTLTLDGTDGTTMTFPSTSATIARTDAANTFTGTQNFAAGSLGAPSITLAGDTTGLYRNAANQWSMTDGSSPFISIINSVGFRMAAGFGLHFSGADSTASGDVGILRSAAGVLRVTDAGSGDGTIRGKFMSSAGTAGVATFGPSVVTSITIKDGIITAIS